MFGNMFKKKRYLFEDEGVMVVDMDHTAGRYYDEAMKKLEVESYQGDEMVVNMGPQHPSTHGVLRLELVLDGEVVKKTTPHIGYLHRNFEKHAENIPYNEVIPFCDRIDYISSMNQGMAYALAVEKLIGLTELPEKVEYMRVLCCELNRIASHLIAVGTFGLDVGAITPFLWAFRDREKILDLLEWLTGARMLYNYIWVGGLAREMPDGWDAKVREFVDYFGPKMTEFNKLLTKNHIFIERTADVGVLPEDIAVSYGCTGPVLRGSGVKWDLRKDEPYSTPPWDLRRFAPHPAGFERCSKPCWTTLGELHSWYSGPAPTRRPFARAAAQRPRRREYFRCDDCPPAVLVQLALRAGIGALSSPGEKTVPIALSLGSTVVADRTLTASSSHLLSTRRIPPPDRPTTSFRSTPCHATCLHCPQVKVRTCRPWHRDQEGIAFIPISIDLQV